MGNGSMYIELEKQKLFVWVKHKRVFYNPNENFTRWDKPVKGCSQAFNFQKTTELGISAKQPDLFH